MATPDRSSWLVLTITIGPPFLRWDCWRRTIAYWISEIWRGACDWSAATCIHVLLRAVAISAHYDDGGEWWQLIFFFSGYVHSLPCPSMTLRIFACITLSGLTPDSFIMSKNFFVSNGKHSWFAIKASSAAVKV